MVKALFVIHVAEGKYLFLFLFWRQMVKKKLKALESFSVNVDSKMNFFTCFLLLGTNNRNSN